MTVRLYPLGFIGIGISTSMFVLMAGSIDEVGWWQIEPPLRYAIMGMMIVGVVMDTAAAISRSRAKRGNGNVTRTDKTAVPDSRL